MTLLCLLKIAFVYKVKKKKMLLYILLVEKANMLYLNSPNGVGFSYSANTSNYYGLIIDETHISFFFFLHPNKPCFFAARCLPC